jgi:methyltransferase (TIGR00027 family)
LIDWNGDMEAELKGIPETLLIPVWARAAETNRNKPMIRDHKAVEMVSRINYDFSRFEKSWLTQVGISVRTELLDKAVSAFVRKNPDAVVINLGAGLDTRYVRMNLDNILWYELDVPEVISLRRRFFDETDHYCFLSKSVFDLSWIEDVDYTGRPVLFIAEGLFMYFEEAEVKSLLNRIANRFPGADMLFEMLAPILVGKTGKHDSVSKIDSEVEFRWGMANSRKMSDWYLLIDFVEEWNYFDYHKDRWRWFGFIARLPLLRPRFASRIVHLHFI